MAIHTLEETGLKRNVTTRARAIISREAILKSRDTELNKILGRLKQLLAEDEIVIVAHKDVFRENTDRTIEFAAPRLPYLFGDAPTIDFDIGIDAARVADTTRAFVYGGHTLNGTATAENMGTYGAWLRGQGVQQVRATIAEAAVRAPF